MQPRNAHSILAWQKLCKPSEPKIEQQFIYTVYSTMQKCLSDLRSNLTTISSAASSGQTALKTTIEEALGAILQSENDFINNAMEVLLSPV